MVQTLPGGFIDVQGDKNKSAGKKKSRTNLCLGLTWAKDDPKKGHRWSLQLHDPTISKQ